MMMICALLPPFFSSFHFSNPRSPTTTVVCVSELCKTELAESSGKFCTASLVADVDGIESRFCIWRKERKERIFSSFSPRKPTQLYWSTTWKKKKKWTNSGREKKLFAQLRISFRRLSAKAESTSTEWEGRIRNRCCAYLMNWRRLRSFAVRIFATESNSNRVNEVNNADDSQVKSH